MASSLHQKLFRIPSNIAVSVGLHWDFVGSDPVDLDLSAVSFSSEGVLLDVVFFNHPFPVGTDEAALRDCELLVDPQQLPYMFMSGDSRIGGEEENRLPGLALAARRRALQMRTGKSDELRRLSVIESIFSRIYDEADLEEVEKVLNDKRGCGFLFDEEGRAVRSGNAREMCDESVTFVMHKIPSDAAAIFLVVTSYNGADFSVLPSVRLVVVNEMTNEKVGTIDLKHATGNGTANLACMLCRVPTKPSSSAAPNANGTSANEAVRISDGPPQMWDLRELNIRTFGYTFVDVLPTMLDVLGLEANSHGSAVWQLPDYSLSKELFGGLTQPLSDVRFGVGWTGEHDLDAFMVMLDEKNNYVDHVCPKPVKLQSTFPHTARHSGDALNGYGAIGDEEFIDLVVYRLPPEVHTVIFGACYVESSRKTKSIVDVPELYMRLQNRSAAWPNAIEVDRWNIHCEMKEEREERKREREARRSGELSADGLNQQQRSRNAKRYLPYEYKGPDDKTYPVQVLVLGMMVKTGESSMAELYPEACSQQRRQEAEEVGSGQGDGTPRGSGAPGRWDRSGGFPPDEAVVSVFQNLPIHEYIPTGRMKGFTEMMPYMRCIAKYCRSRTSGSMNANGSMSGTMTNPLRLQVGQSQLDTQISIWDHLRESTAVLCYHAVKVQFLEVQNLQPMLPHTFKCHGEAWVCEKTPFSECRSLGVYDRPTFRTPYLMNRQDMRWDEGNPSTAAVLFVREFDRIRVVIYERAAFGYVDIDLMEIDELWAHNHSSDTIDQRSGDAYDRWFPLNCGTLTGGLVRLRLSRVPIGEALEESEQTIAENKRKRREYATAVGNERNEAVRESYSGPCCLM
uniref:Uncharacterized protein TCIL3000_8_7660 n=1 Tax=Trypanosoma congolense (strain IL3000) TaxID=1068625 RepID=G0UT23_TRYCI|nr:unnamed protein product [Trypanosoma congolense IL3000]